MIQIEPAKIKDVIGKGGDTINGIIDETGVKIDIDQDVKVSIASVDNLIKGKDGLVHISQLANDRVNKVEDVVKLGDEILVKVTEIDKQGRVNLSRKAMLNEDGSTKNEEK